MHLAPSLSPPPPSVVALLDADAELAFAVPVADRERARRVLVTPAIALDPGAIELADLPQPETMFAALVVEGELVCEVEFAGRSLSGSLSPGDVLTPWEPDIDGLPVRRRLFAISPVRLAVLDTRFLMASARWPSLMLTIQRRLAEQEYRRAVHGAICQLPRVHDRLIAILRLLASRSGRVSPDGIIVPVKATHEALGRLIGARRPTVSLALKELEDDGRLRRLPGGGWLLRDALEPIAPDLA